MVRDTVRDLAVKACPGCGARFAAAAAFCSFDGQALERAAWDPARAPLTGTVVGGRYEVLAPLGEGAMGIVYEVRHLGLDRRFAMKVLRPKLAADPRTSARFVQEAKAAAAIKHPGVVAITDFGALEDETPYLVMERLDGETLAARLRRGALPGPVAVELAARIADALAASHAAGVVHRDLKPDNVFLVADPASPEAAVRIVDFGAAKVASGSKLTRPGMVFGTPHYMSPEHASGQAVDARSDVYSLGVVLFEMLTGRVPFEADTFMGVLTLQMFTPAPPPSALVPAGTVAPWLESIVLCALAKDAPERFPTMDAFAAALRAGRPLARPVPRGATMKLSPAAPQPPLVARPPASPDPRRLVALALAALAGVAGAVAVGRYARPSTRAVHVERAAVPETAPSRASPDSRTPAPSTAVTGTPAPSAAAEVSAAPPPPRRARPAAAAPSPSKSAAPSTDFPDPWSR